MKTREGVKNSQLLGRIAGNMKKVNIKYPWIAFVGSFEMQANVSQAVWSLSPSFSRWNPNRRQLHTLPAHAQFKYCYLHYFQHFNISQIVTKTLFSVSHCWIFTVAWTSISTPLKSNAVASVYSHFTLSNRKTTLWKLFFFAFHMLQSHFCHRSVWVALECTAKSQGVSRCVCLQLRVQKPSSASGHRASS